MNKIIDWIGVENEGLRRITKLSFLIPNSLFLYTILFQNSFETGEDIDIILKVSVTMVLFLSLSLFVSLLIIVWLSKWIAEGFKKG